MNAIWVCQGKTKLALANVSGAMMIQATVPSGLGLLFTNWHFDHALLWSELITVAATLHLLAGMRAHKFTPARLNVAAGFYLVFALGLVLLANCRYNPRVARLAISTQQAREAAMKDHLRSRVLIATAAAVGLTVPLLGAGAPAFASGGGGVRASGACTNGGHFELKAKHDDGRIELEYEVDSNRSRQRWAVRITDNGAVVVSRHATTTGRSDSFTVRKSIANKIGRDHVRARATFKSRTCRGAVTL